MHMHILKVWGNAINPTPSTDAYLPEETIVPTFIPIWNDWALIGLFWKASPKQGQ